MQLDPREQVVSYPDQRRWGLGMRLTTTEVQYLKMKLPYMYLCLDMTERPKKQHFFWPSSWCSLFCFTSLALSLSRDLFNLSLHHNYIIMFMCARGQKQGLVQITQLLELPFVYQIRFFFILHNQIRPCWYISTLVDMKTLKIRKQLPNCEVLKIVAFFDNCNVLHYSFYKVKILNFQPSENIWKFHPQKLSLWTLHMGNYMLLLAIR